MTNTWVGVPVVTGQFKDNDFVSVAMDFANKPFAVENTEPRISVRSNSGKAQDKDSSVRARSRQHNIFPIEDIDVLQTRSRLLIKHILKRQTDIDNIRRVFGILWDFGDARVRVRHYPAVLSRIHGTLQGGKHNQ